MQNQDIVLLVPKLQLPRLHRDLVGRARLLTMLDRTIHKKLTLITAPAGFGKTTLVRQWIAHRELQKDGAAFAWLSLDANDNDLMSFWYYLVSAFQHVFPQQDEITEQVLQDSLQLPFRGSPLHNFIIQLLNKIMQVNHPIVIVLEDYHQIIDPQIHTSLAFFIEHLPTNLHLVIMTRTKPPLPLARLRMNNELNEIEMQDLRFSPEEMAAFLHLELGYEPARATIKHLSETIEGWAAGLRLLTLSIHQNTDQAEKESVLAAFSGYNRSLLDYFVSEVLTTQSAEICLFLLHTSILDRFNASLCDTVCQSAQSEQFLRTLERENLFIEQLDGRGEWYRYHALFAEAMQQEARKQLGQTKLEELALRASHWYEEHNLLHEAIDTAFQAKNHKRAVNLMEQLIVAEDFRVGAARFRGEREISTILHWVSQLPKELLKHHPTICLSQATALIFLFTMNQDQPERLKELEAALTMAEDAWQAEGNVEKLGEVYALRSLLTRHKGSSLESAAYARKALHYLSEGEQGWRSLALSTLGMYLFSRGELREAQILLLDAQSLMLKLHNPNFARAYGAMTSFIQFEAGNLILGIERFRKLLTDAHIVHDLDDIAHAQIGLAFGLYHLNELDDIEERLQEAIAISKDMNDEEMLVISTVRLATLQRTQGFYTQARHQLTTLLIQLQPENTELYQRHQRLILHELAYIAFLLGDYQAVQDWWQNRRGNPNELSMLAVEREEVLYARLLLARGEKETAEQYLCHLIKKLQEQDHLLILWEAQLLLVRALSAQGRDHEASSLLHAILEQTRSETPLRLFLNEGDPVERLLRRLQDKSLESYIQSILQAFEQEATQKQTEQPASEILSSQELKVLRLLAAGRSNPEIARELIVSVNTIRTQVQSIYRKLDVNNRVAASEAGRRLGLI